MMHRSLLLITFIILLGGGLRAQNLVENGSFEDYTTCPEFFSQIQFATGWISAWGTADFYHECASIGSQMTVPQSASGFQYPAQGGGYAGIVTYAAPGSVPDPEHSREILARQLSQPLIPGLPVYASFKISVAVAGNQWGASPRWTCNGIGLRFDSIATYDGLGPHPNTAVAHLVMTPFDTSDWITVGSVCVPDHAYDFIQLGNFFADSLLVPLIIDASGGAEYAYVFIDEVCVSYMSSECALPNAIEQILYEHPLVYPNPCFGELHIVLGRSSQLVRGAVLLNAIGQRCAEWNINAASDRVTLPMPLLTNGIYQLMLTGPGLPGSSRSIVQVVSP